MGLRDWWNGFMNANTAQKDALMDGAAGLFQYPNQAIFPTGDFLDMVKGGYNKNAIVYACIRAKVNAFNEARFQVVNDNGGDVVENHHITELIQNPNPFTGEYAFWDNIITSLDLAGIAYIMKSRNSERGDVEMLWNLRPDTIKPVTSDKTFISHYEQRVGGSSRDISVDDMITIKYNNPENPFIGQPPLNAALMDIGTDNEASEFKKVVLQNRGSSPAVIVSTKQKMTPEMRDKFVSDWQRKFSGSNRGRPVLVEMGAMDIQTISLNMRDLMIADLTDISEARICGALGVPPIIAGANVGLRNATYSNADAFDKYFYQRTIIPLQNLVDDSLNSDLIIEMDSQVRGAFDNSKVTSLASVRQKEFDNSDKAYNSGWMTRNEARNRVGLVEVGDGDTFKESQPAPLPMKSKPQMEMQYKLSAGAEGVGLLDEAIGRRASAEKHLDRLEKWAKKEFKRESREMMALFNDVTGHKDLSLFEMSQFDNGLNDLQKRWSQSIALEGIPILADILNDASHSTALHLGIAFDLSSEFQQEFVRDYGFQFAQKISQTSADDVRNVLLRSQDEGLSLAEISSALREKFTNWTSVRSDMVARTETIRANNRGAENVWKSEGIEGKKWLIADDACDWCQEMQNTEMGVGGNFFEVGDNLVVPPEKEGGAARVMNFNYEDISAPPLHPNCRCVLVPVIGD